MIPDWLSPTTQVTAVTPTKTAKQTKLELLHLTYETMFEGILLQISSGIPLKEILRNDLREVEYEFFLRWIHKDEERKMRYHEAQELGTEVLASEIIEIADGQNSFEDVQRSKLRIDARKFVMGAWNRKRYGDVKQVEQNVNVNLVDAMEAANQRVIDAKEINVIEGEVIE